MVAFKYGFPLTKGGGGYLCIVLLKAFRCSCSCCSLSAQHLSFSHISHTHVPFAVCGRDTAALVRYNYDVCTSTRVCELTGKDVSAKRGVSGWS